ncbi:nucleotide exchange factor GrpE [Idiomarina tyrosinivorans]|uniref:Protein GrpE n=1 Tax=Idiomarina tyrosinivorans TaxID=1445662 RepID=A0A432ZR99_9GAMM|nr:nucleotide exchange factor GrpE [Idiomarina tyrosinivorans]RUO80419.1 nucleotide exchange factor GrpE [Idiomarina tyrosinivorans]
MTDKNVSENSEQQTHAEAAENTEAEQQQQSQQQSAAEAEATASEAPQTERLNELELALTKAEAKVKEQQESVLRAQAEMENTRRRAAQDVEKAQKFALEKFAGELLTTVDNLERALQVAEQEENASSNFVEGIQLTYKSLTATLEKFGVTAVGEQGETFNPDLHQAMSMQESDEFPNNTVMAVMQKGYQLNGRLLRPAMVMVARGGQAGVDTKA